MRSVGGMHDTCDLAEGGRALSIQISFRTALAVTVLLGFMAAPALAQAPAQAPETGRDCDGGLKCLNQGWDDEQRAWWYTTSQGSRLLPLSWMLALEHAASSEKQIDRFLSEKNLQRFGYLGAPVSTANPFGLPLGFAVDEASGADANIMCDTFPKTCLGNVMQQPWVGMTCAACHTNDIEYGGKRIRVDGAPTLADFQTFSEELLAALQATLADTAKFDRFAHAVLQGGFSTPAAEGLKDQLREQVAWQEKLQNANATTLRYGHGRLDAQGYILNKVAAIAQAPQQIQTVQADGAASYPHLWNTAQQDRLQWNGLASNTASITVPIDGDKVALGPLGRNTGQVIGVFAHIAVKPQVQAYKSSLRIRSLIQLEKQLTKLKSPRWPENLLIPIDLAMAARGEQHFRNQRCYTCHTTLAWDDLNTQHIEKMDSIRNQNTDIFLACNVFLHRAKAGKFLGQPYPVEQGGLQLIQEEEFTRNMLGNAVLGAITGQVSPQEDAAKNVFRSAERSVQLSADVDYLPGVSDKEKQQQAKLCLDQGNELLKYKARPLNGIWATAPYLHNGSIPTLYDLFLPETVANLRGYSKESGPTRPETFGVGSRQFDPKKVGFVTDLDKNPTTFTVRKAGPGSEPIPGNYNSGHNFGTHLTEQERYELVEYLKSL
jgi:hypothetical protein